ncbi:hypothetical protein AOLI_G00007440 [Acnodon oligacanthus]
MEKMELVVVWVLHSRTTTYPLTPVPISHGLMSCHSESTLRQTTFQQLRPDDEECHIQMTCSSALHFGWGNISTVYSQLLERCV